MNGVAEDAAPARDVQARRQRAKRRRVISVWREMGQQKQVCLRTFPALPPRRINRPAARIAGAVPNPHPVRRRMRVLEERQDQALTQSGFSYI